MNKINLVVFVIVIIGVASNAAAQGQCTAPGRCVDMNECNTSNGVVTVDVACEARRQAQQQTVPPPRPRTDTSYVWRVECYEYMRESDVECPDDNPECWRTIRAVGGRATSDPLVHIGTRASCECLQPRLVRDIIEATTDLSTRGSSSIHTVIRQYMCFDPRQRERAEQTAHEHLDLVSRIVRLEHACGPEGMSAAHPELPDNPAWQELCSRVAQIPQMTLSIRVLGALIDDLDERVQRLWNIETPALAEALCGITPTEWHHTERSEIEINGETRAVNRARGLSREEILARCRAFRERGQETQETVDSLMRLAHFQLGVGALVVGHTQIEVISGYAVAFAQWEPMFDRTFGLYIRGLIGYGSMGDAPGIMGTAAVGESGVWGLSAGLAIRADRVVALNIGVAFDSSLVEGMRDRVGGDYRWHTLGGEIRLRLEPVEHFAIELGVSLNWSRVRVQPANDPGVLVDRDGPAPAGTVGLEFTF